MRGPAANAGTISSTGGRTNMPASGPAPTDASTSTATATPPRPKNAPKHGSRRSRRAGTGSSRTTLLTREEIADEFLLMGLRLAEGIDMERFAAIAGRPLDPDRIAALREHGLIETTAAGRLRVSMAGFPVLDAVVADLAA